MTVALHNDGFAHRATLWRARDRELKFGARPLLMGIVNVTPDSFSDGGKFLATDRAIEHALQLIKDGADLLDIGGESTRPYATPVDVNEELRRVLPVVEAICSQARTPLSIDTSKAQVASAALKAGAVIINDITGLSDPAMIELARSTGAGVCAMHMQGTPQTMQDKPHYDNVVEDVFRYLRERRDMLIAAGIEPHRLCLDPGIGFGKMHQHNITLAVHCWRFHELGCPVLVGHSRKGFIGKLIGDKVADRTYGSVGVSLALAAQQVQILRVHDVRATREALLLFEACGGLDGTPGVVAREGVSR
jgi:dihydropteroate synthase